MSRSTHDIITSFLAGKPNTNYNSLTSFGYALYSYSTPIATWCDNTLYVNTQKYSRTTSRQQGLLEAQIHNAQIDNAQINVVECDKNSYFYFTARVLSAKVDYRFKR